MSRRAPNPAAERAAQNQATIKNLLKLEANKTCADCKRNKHPRWASWNLGIFICIRCSGIHRGMGTHISRVKSVDLDSWTDEQLQSVVNWGNARANKYWEAKLAAGHAPSEGKIENFIRTKYELKRWVMDGPFPDPSTLDGEDDVLPDKAKSRQQAGSEPPRKSSSVGQSPASRAPTAAPVVDLIGAVDPIPHQRSGPPTAKIPPKAEPAPPKATGTKDSLLGLDFFGSGSAPQRPASTTGVTAGGQSRPDLKQSILSLYATAPKTQSPSQQQPQQNQQQHQIQQHQQQHGAFGGMGHHSSGSMGGFNDAFGNLSMGSPNRPGPADPFASLGSAARNSPNRSSFGGGLGGGGFFDSKPSHQPKLSNSSFGAYTSPTPAATSAPAPAPALASTKPSSAMDDLFDFSATTNSTSTSAAFSPSQPMSQISQPLQSSSAFNLSSPKSHPAMPTTTSTASALGGANLSGADVWGANDWTIGTSTTATTTTTITRNSNSNSNSISINHTMPSLPSAKRAELPKTSGMGWGSSGGAFATTPIVPGTGGGFSPAPKIAADEEFGGWTSSAGPATSGVATTTKAFGEDTSNDLFNNVWQ